MNAKSLLETLHEYFPLEETTVIRDCQRLRITHSLTLVDGQVHANVWAKTPNGVFNFTTEVLDNGLRMNTSDKIVADTLCSSLAQAVREECERQDVNQIKLQLK